MLKMKMFSKSENIFNKKINLIYQKKKIVKLQSFKIFILPYFDYFISLVINFS